LFDQCLMRLYRSTYQRSHCHEFRSWKTESAAALPDPEASLELKEALCLHQQVMSPKQVVCLPYWCQYQSRHAETFHPSAQHSRMVGWKFYLICLAALQRDKKDCRRRWACNFILPNDASFMVGIRMFVLIQSSCETFSDTSMSLSVLPLHFVLVSWALVVTNSSIYV